MRTNFRSSLPRRMCLTALSLSVIGACTILPLTVDTKATAPALDGYGDTTFVASQANEPARRRSAHGMAQAFRLQPPGGDPRLQGRAGK